MNQTRTIIEFIGWHDIPSKMFDAKNDSVASYATISPFEGTLNIICVAQNDAGSSHRFGSFLFFESSLLPHIMFFQRRPFKVKSV